MSRCRCRCFRAYFFVASGSRRSELRHGSFHTSSVLAIFLCGVRACCSFAQILLRTIPRFTKQDTYHAFDARPRAGDTGRSLSCQICCLDRFGSFSVIVTFGSTKVLVLEGFLWLQKGHNETLCWWLSPSGFLLCVVRSFAVRPHTHPSGAVCRGQSEESS